jgi:hypothetical protein
VIHDFLSYGIKAKSSSNILIHNNVVNGIRPINDDEPTYLKWTAPLRVIELGDSTDFEVTDNIAASGYHSGFSLPAWPCGTSPKRPLSGNVAHSISGFGLIV